MGRTTLRSALRRWINASPGKDAAEAFGPLRVAAIEAGFKARRTRNPHDAEQVILWACKQTNTPVEALR